MREFKAVPPAKGVKAPSKLDKATDDAGVIQFKQDLVGKSIEEQEETIKPSKPVMFSKKAVQYSSNASVQRSGEGEIAASEVHKAANQGFKGPASTLPHLPAVQRSFGKYDVSGVRAHVGGEAAAASQAMGARAYTSGERIGFKASPDLHTAAHEAAHVVQQRSGVSLPGGVGSTGDHYERHADAVASRVVQGKSAEALLDDISSDPSPIGAVQAAVQLDGPGSRGKGNPGKRIGEVTRTSDFAGPSRKQQFMQVEAIEGTWLSAATRDLGWDKYFVAKQGYGAYVPGIVLRSDGTSDFNKDSIKPGEVFFVLKPDQVAGDKEQPVEPTAVEGEEMPKAGDVLKGPGVDVAGGINKGLLIAATLCKALALTSLTAGIIVIGQAIASIYFGMRAVAYAHGTAERRAGLRARCYAATASLFEHGYVNMSRVYRSSLAPQCDRNEKAWIQEWAKTIDDWDLWLNQQHQKVAQVLAKKGMQVTKDEILTALQKAAGNDPKAFCDQLMNSKAIMDNLNYMDSMHWKMDLSTRYPD